MTHSTQQRIESPLIYAMILQEAVVLTSVNFNGINFVKKLKQQIREVAIQKGYHPDNVSAWYLHTEKNGANIMKSTVGTQEKPAFFNFRKHKSGTVITTFVATSWTQAQKIAKEHFGTFPGCCADCHNSNSDPVKYEVKYYHANAGMMDDYHYLSVVPACNSGSPGGKHGYERVTEADWVNTANLPYFRTRDGILPFWERG